MLFKRTCLFAFLDQQGSLSRHILISAIDHSDGRIKKFSQFRIAIAHNGYFPRNA